MEIFTGNPAPGSRDAESCSWKRLGFLSFDKNERSGYQARELKSVHVNATAYLLRLVVHACHPNKLNTDSQASARVGRQATACLDGTESKQTLQKVLGMSVLVAGNLMSLPLPLWRVRMGVKQIGRAHV